MGRYFSTSLQYNYILIDQKNYFDNIFLKGGQAQAASNSVTSIPVKDKIMVWQNRLCHPNFSYLKQLFPTLFKNLNPLIFQ